MPTLYALRDSISNAAIRNVHIIDRIKGITVRDPLLRRKISEIKVMLTENGIDDLSTTGKLEISENIRLSNGLLKPRKGNIFSVDQNLIKNVLLMDPESVRRPVQYRRTLEQAVWSKSYKTARVFREEAIWAADEIIINDNVTIIFTSGVKILKIIANTVRIGSNVVFTYTVPDFDYDNSQPIPQKRQKAQTKIPDVENQIIHGAHGDPGVAFARHGQKGINAPAFELWAANMEAKPPAFFFSGQDGQDGQQGQQGQNGQNGAQGSAGKRAGWGVWGRCERHSGSGGNGGNGGAGGPGGNGGDGGDGGQVTFYLPPNVQLSLGSFDASLEPGRAGNPGKGGQSGRGGKGGALGRPDSTGILGQTSCGAKGNRSAGRDGQDGREGPNGGEGRPGNRRNNGNIHFVEINADDIRIELNNPLITRLNPYKARVGDSVSIHGRNLPANVRVAFDDIEATPSTVSDDTIDVTVPDVAGGTVDIRVKYDNGRKETNAIELKVLPVIESISQGGKKPSRFIPGKSIQVHGSGFSPDLIMMANDRPCPDIGFVSDKVLDVELIRPFEDNEFPNSLGEEITLQLIANEPGFASNEFTITLDTFRVLMIGDSIIWGQGLQNHEKFRNLLLQEFRKRKHHKGVYYYVHAHSGATIGYNMSQSSLTNMVPDDTNLPPLPGEIPTAYPTILQQMNIQLNGQSSDPTIDFILTDGGINDVGISRILNPMVKTKDLMDIIDFHCYRGAKRLLQEMITRFPSAKIFYTGYYKIVSRDTGLEQLRYLLTALGFKIAGIPGAVNGILVDAAIRNKVIKHCALFADRAHANIRKAIEEVRNENNLRENHITFINPGFTDLNAAFAPDSLLFGIEIPSLKPMDNNVIAIQRRSDCVLHADRTSRWLCERASTGHPNPEGAEQYFLRILQRLEAIVPTI